MKHQFWFTGKTEFYNDNGQQRMSQRSGPPSGGSKLVRRRQISLSIAQFWAAPKISKNESKPGKKKKKSATGAPIFFGAHLQTRKPYLESNLEMAFV